MKKDLELVKHLLSDLDAQRSGSPSTRPNTMDEHSSEEMSTHIQWMADAGLIKTVGADAGGDDKDLPIKITPLGKEFLSYSNNKMVWKTVLTQIEDEKVPMVLEQIKEALKVATMQRYNT